MTYSLRSDYLKQHLSEIDKQNTPTSNFQTTDTNMYHRPAELNKTASDLQFFNFDINSLPCGQFYPKGTLFLIRAATVKEIQAYSMVDDTNIYDIVEKMNDMLASCIRLKYPDNKMGTYLDIKDQDRFYLIFMIRELTFQQGNNLGITKICTCGKSVELELKRENFILHQIDDALKKYYYPELSGFSFTTINDKEFNLTPPTTTKLFTDYIIKENNIINNKHVVFKNNAIFNNGRNSISFEGIKSKLLEYENIDDISFHLNAVVNKMIFGIKEMKKCSWASTLYVLLNDVAIFIIPDAFDFIKNKTLLTKHYHFSDSDIDN